MFTSVLHRYTQRPRCRYIPTQAHTHTHKSQVSEACKELQFTKSMWLYVSIFVTLKLKLRNVWSMYLLICLNHNESIAWQPKIWVDNDSSKKKAQKIIFVNIINISLIKQSNFSSLLPNFICFNTKATVKNNYTVYTWESKGVKHKSVYLEGALKTCQSHVGMSRSPLRIMTLCEFGDQLMLCERI